MKKFKDLVIGESFYPPMNNHKMDLKWQLMKVSQVHLTEPPPWETLKTTQNVIDNNGHFNSVVVRSIDDKTNGYYDFIPDNALVYTEPPRC